MPDQIAVLPLAKALSDLETPDAVHRRAMSYLPDLRGASRSIRADLGVLYRLALPTEYGGQKGSLVLKASGVGVGGNLSGLAAPLHDAIAPIDEDDVRQVGASPALVQLGVGDEDNEVTGAHKVRGGTVHADLPCSALAGDDVGGQSVAVGAIADVDALSREKISGIKEVRIHGDGPDVVEVGLSHRGAMDLGRHHRPQA